MRMLSAAGLLICVLGVAAFTVENTPHPRTCGQSLGWNGYPTSVPVNSTMNDANFQFTNTGNTNLTISHTGAAWGAFSNGVATGAQGVTLGMGQTIDIDVVFDANSQSKGWVVLAVTTSCGTIADTIVLHTI